MLNKHTVEEHPNQELTALPLAFYPGPYHLLAPLPHNRWSLPPPLLKAMRGPRDVTIRLIEAVQAVLDKAAAAATTAVTEVVAAAGMAAVTVVAIEGMAAVAAMGRRVATAKAAVAVAASPTALPSLTQLLKYDLIQ